MPQRTNDFQKLVYLVRLNLAEGAKVTESAMRRDRITGCMREIDVCIEGEIGGHPVTVSIECRGSKRVADVSWVESMKSKHDRLPTNALILASRSGFTSEAGKVASSYGIEAISLTEVDSVDFPALLGCKSSLWTRSVSITRQKVVLRVNATSTLAQEDVVAIPDNLVHASDGSEVCTVNHLVQMMFSNKEMGIRLLEMAKEDHRFFEVTWESPSDSTGNALFLKKLQPETLRKIEFIRVQGPAEIKVEEFRMRRGILGATNLAWGQTKILGQNASVVATRDIAGKEKITLTFTGGSPNAGLQQS